MGLSAALRFVRNEPRSRPIGRDESSCPPRGKTTPPVRLMMCALRQHWPEYLIDGALLGLFMISACGFAVVLEHPDSPVHQAISNTGLRHLFGGIAMGLTNIALIYSPWGQRSGAHMNP